MTTLALARGAGEVPDGTQWPGSDTLVLLNRDLHPDANPSRLSRFADDRWDLNPAIFEEHNRSSSLNFALVPAELRLAAKHYVWQLLNHPEPRPVAGRTGRLAVVTVEGVFTASLQFVLKWLAEQGVTQLCQVTQEMLDDYVEALKDDEVGIERCYRRINEIRRLWAYRDILPPSMRLPDAPPWAGEDTQDLMGRTRGDRENRTRRIGEVTMQSLLRWALRFVEDFAEDVLAAHAEYLGLRSRNVEVRRKAGLTGQRLRQPGQVQRKIAISGPAADAYRYRVNAASREFAGRVLTRERQARDLLGNPLLQIYHGEGMTCVFNPATAACQLRGDADDSLVTPDTDDCRPKCPNIARTDRDIEYVRHRAAELAEIVDDPPAPPIRHERQRHELGRLKSITDAHERGAADR